MTTIDDLSIRGGKAAILRDGREQGRRCLLVPPFGVPASALELLARALAEDGHLVFRLDPRNHVGLGTGEITDFTLSEFVEDCRTAVERYRADVVVAVSMGARAALRALARAGQPARAVFLLPVVDVRSTLAAILGRDWFGVDERELPTHMPVLGYEVAAAAFRRDCLGHELTSVDGTRRDLVALGDRALLLPGIDDPWVELAMVEQLAASIEPGGRPSVLPVACDRHDLHTDPELALRLMAVVIDQVQTLLGRQSIVSP